MMCQDGNNSQLAVNKVWPTRANAVVRRLAVVALVSLTPSLVMAQQTETTADCAEGTIPEPVNLEYGNSTLNCGIDSLGESDQFTFSGTTNEVVRLNLVTLSDDVDPVVEVRDDTGAMVGDGSCSANSVSRCSLSFDLLLTRDGAHLITLSDSGADNTGEYLLQLERLFPAPSIVQLAYDFSISDTLSPSTDTDYYNFAATAGTSLKFNFVTLLNDLDPRVQIRDPSGTLIIDGIADGAGCDSGAATRCSFALELTPAASGDYSLVVHDDDLFNTGDYELSLWCLYGACVDGPTPDPDGRVINHMIEIEDSIETPTDGDFYSFNGAVGTQARFNLVTLANNFDPRIEIRDPNGIVVIDGIADGGGCNANSVTRCSFAVDLSPAMTGTYSVLVYDDDAFNISGYRIGLWCIQGDCDSDADSFPDRDREVLLYDTSVNNRSIEDTTDADYYRFMGTSGDQIRLTVTTLTNNLDPRMEVRDPNGILVIDGIADGGGCDANSVSTCSFSVDLSPATTGEYALLLYDNDSFNSGGYTLDLICVFGGGPGFTCADLDQPPPLCADNCSVFSNPNQFDTNVDGYGNACDPDFDDNGAVNFADLMEMQAGFFGSDPELDLNGDGIANFLDLAVMQFLFFGPPGPSCAFPNSP